MTVAYVSQTITAVGYHTSLTVPYPDNVGPPFPPQSGETMWLALCYRTADAGCLEPTVSGWSVARAPGNGNGFRLGIYYKQGDGGGGSALATWNVQVLSTGIIYLLDGTHTVSPLDALSFGVVLGNAQGLYTGSSVTTSALNCGLLGIWAGATAGYWENHSTVPPGPEGQGLVDLTYYFVPGMDTPAVGASEGWYQNPIGATISAGFDLAEGAGVAGARTAQGYTPSSSHTTETEASANVVLLSIKPFSGPSRPIITAPVDAETITIGRTYSITWTASTDPNIAQSALTYGLDYSLNDGLTWTVITAATSAGAVTHAWNTTGIPATPQAKLRIRAFNGTEFGTYDTTGRIILATDVTPGAPINMHGEQPDGTTVTLFDRTLVLLVKGTFSDLGDVMTGYQLDWGTDGVTYGTASGTVTTSVFTHSFPLATFANGLVYFRARTKDTAGTFGPYAYFTLTAATPPAAPNITAPTAGSPPTAPLPTITWTSTGQTHYKITITQGGTVRYAGSFVTSSALSVTSPFPFLNDTLYTLILAYKDSSGLTSPSDSETFTVSFVGPATPTIDVS